MLSMVYQGQEVSEDLVRHIVLTNLQKFKKMFGAEYGEVVVCCDSPNPWRKDVFPLYKANRKKARDSSDTDWEEIFRIVRLIKDEIRENLPYKVIEVPRAEGDDIIATLALHYSGPHMIVSNDKDLKQLQVREGIRQYHPINNTDETLSIIDNPEEFLLEHIIRGDSSDGIPNAYSPDDCFVTKTRQVVLTKKRIEEMKIKKDHYFERNKKLISLFEIPETITKQIVEQYETVEKANRSKILTYLGSKGLKKLLQTAGDF